VAEAEGFFGLPPEGYPLRIEPMPPAEAQGRYLERFHILAEAVDLEPHAQAFDTE
jgi:hypothetical protein